MCATANSYINIWKRVFDFVLAAVGLVVLALPMAVIAAIVWAYSGRPVIFSQERVGRNGGVFRIHKFRTMYVRKQSDSPVTVEGDARITPVGHFLRRWKLDELPQLWNVFVGEMSFVGPRPDVRGYADNLKGNERSILTLRPGITGPATLCYRDEEKLLASMPDPVRYNNDVIFPHKVKLNLEYMQQCSISIDLRLIRQTILPSGAE